MAGGSRRPHKHNLAIASFVGITILAKVQIAHYIKGSFQRGTVSFHHQASRHDALYTWANIKTNMVTQEANNNQSNK
jgi:hypothetical protein